MSEGFQPPPFALLRVAPFRMRIVVKKRGNRTEITNTCQGNVFPVDSSRKMQYLYFYSTSYDDGAILSQSELSAAMIDLLENSHL